MNGLPYTGFPSDDVSTQVKLLIYVREFDGKYKDDLEVHLRRGGFVKGYVCVELNEETKNIFLVTFIPTSKSGKTKPALTEARNILGKAINDWYLANVK
jgi:hypothetical protein